MNTHSSIPQKSKVQSIPLASIRLDAGTQTRAATDASTVNDYAEAFKSGTKFPPCVVFKVGKDYLLADGFHRVKAAEQAGLKSVTAKIHQGTKADALRFALGANVTHGLRRTNADKHYAVELALKEWPDHSDAEIGRICAVTHPFVGKVRPAIQPVTITGSTPPKRIGADGKSRRLPPSRRQASIAEKPATAPPQRRRDGTGVEIPPEAEALWMRGGQNLDPAQLIERMEALPDDDRVMAETIIVIQERTGNQMNLGQIALLLNWAETKFDTEQSPTEQEALAA